MSQPNDFSQIWSLTKSERVLTPDDAAKFMPHAPAWSVVPRRGVPRLQRIFTCRTFSDAMWFTLKVGEIAEAEDQRPTILLDWNRVTVVLRSAKSDGLIRKDFITASKIDAIWQDKPRSDA
jgi:4a-hydroxytetrahydrobiopterin dehydratase